MQYAYEELPLGKRAFALRMRCLEEKKQMEKAKREQLNKKFKQKRNKTLDPQMICNWNKLIV
uniref:Uncharacterized protein n=1 Tax=Loa loa TaxID=7209 RepID=A0A1I7W148_LOALO